MLTDAQKAWVEALRSKRFKQGRNRLAIQNGDEFTYCCLGVACEVYQQRVGGLEIEAVEDRRGLRKGVCRSYDGERNLLPLRVARYFGLATIAGRHTLHPADGPADDLAGLNDIHELTLSQIADVIEFEPEGLFIQQEVTNG